MNIVGGQFTTLGNGLLYIAVIETKVNPNSTRMLFYNGEKVVGEHTVNTRIMSVDASLKEIKIASADKFGSVVISGGDSVEFEFIDGPGTGKGKFGYLTRLKFIGAELYACGDLCQVYKRSSRGWTAIDEAIRVHDKKSVGQALNDMDGFSPDEIYAVGDRGRIFCLGDGKWQIVDSLTNVSLEKVTCHEDGFVYIAGNNGTLIRGRKDQWELWASLEDEGGSDRLWGLNFFQDELYCCTANTLYKIVDRNFKKVDIPIPQEGSYFDIIRGMDCLWIFSVNQLLSFDGSEWKRHGILP